MQLVDYHTQWARQLAGIETAVDWTTAKAVDHTATARLVCLGMAKAYRQAGEGTLTNLDKVHALWTIGGQVPKDWAHKGDPKGPGWTQFMSLWALVLALALRFGMVRRESCPHAEPHPQAVPPWERQWRAYGPDTENAETVILDDRDAWAVALADLASDSGRFDLSEAAELGSFVAGCHGYQVHDESSLKRLQAQAESRHVMATQGDLEGDKCYLKTRRGQLGEVEVLTHGGMDFMDAFRDETGPWTEEFTNCPGCDMFVSLREKDCPKCGTDFHEHPTDIVRKGYEGQANTVTCQRPGCGSINLEPSGFCLDCGYKPLWDIQWDEYQAENDTREGIANGYLSDERVERGNRFYEEFQVASDLKGDAQALVKAYKAAWTRYRAALLRIGGALADAPQGHGLWGHVHLTRPQWDVIEAVYAARTGMDKRLRDGRLAIARQRLRDSEVKKWAELAYTLL